MSFIIEYHNGRNWKRQGIYHDGFVSEIVKELSSFGFRVRYCEYPKGTKKWKYAK